MSFPITDLSLNHLLIPQPPELMYIWHYPPQILNLNLKLNQQLIHRLSLGNASGKRVGLLWILLVRNPKITALALSFSYQAQIVLKSLM